MSERKLNRLPLFPLPAHVLPHGKLKLRIFEPRYLRMVTQSCQDNSGFGICMQDATDKGQIMPVGTLVKIVDFETLEDGQLGITVQGDVRFSIIERHKESDGLNVGVVKILDNWQEQAVPTSAAHLAESLRRLFEEYPEVGGLYPDGNFHSLNWVVSRWLEVLPMDSRLKQQLFASSCAKAALDAVEQLLSEFRRM